MKKRLVTTLALALSLSTSAIVMAAPGDNPFNDVPAQHWAYASINQLVKAGIVDGYQGKYNGGKTLTRYEMAQVIAKAMGKTEKAQKADAQTKAAMDKLSKEFAAELNNNFLIRVDELEKKTDNMKMDGSYARWDWEMGKLKQNGKTIDSSNADSYFRFNLGFKGQVNEDWEWKLWIRRNNDAYASGSGSPALNRAYVTGPVGEAKVSVGRQYNMALDGTLWESYFDGLKVEFGNKVKNTLYYGYKTVDSQVLFYDNKNKGLGNYIIAKSEDADKTSYKNLSRTRYYGIESEYDVTPTTNLRGGYYVLTGSDLPDTIKYGTTKVPVTTKTAKIWEVMLEQKLGNDFDFQGTYSKNNAKMDNSGHTLKLGYKETNKKQPGTYRLEAQYRSVGRFIPLGGVYETDFVQFDDGITYNHNSKIWEFNVDYIPWKSVKWSNTLSIAKSTDGSNLKLSVLKSQMNFYF